MRSAFAGRIAIGALSPVMELTIDRLGMEGDGIAHGPNAEVFVPFTLPGEVVSGELVDGNLERSKLLALSPDRVTPICKHFGQCGGCSLQHTSDDFLANWKVGTVVRGLAAQGLAANLRKPVISPPKSRRRAVFAGRRTKKTVQVGFYGRASDLIIPIDECHVVAPELLLVLPALAALTRIGATRTTPVRISVSLCDTGVDVAVSQGKELDVAARANAISIAMKHDFPRLTWNDEVIAAARPALRRYGRASIAAPPGAFAQATADGEAALVAAVCEVTQHARKIADLFAGCGTFTLPLAENAEMHAVESDAAMLAAMDKGWRQAIGLKLVTHEVRDLFARPLIAAELNRFDAVVLDPPRAGALAQCEQIGLSNVLKVAYVSCNPATFARDAKLLAAKGFSIDWIQVVDQFRWSGHVELVASLSR